MKKTKKSPLKLLAILGVLSLIAGAFYLNTQSTANAAGPLDYFKIEIGQKPTTKSELRKLSKKELLERIVRLETAVNQLQTQVYLNKHIVVRADKSQHTTCYIETAFDGTFSATKATKTAAKAKALEKCNAKTNSGIYCKSRNVKCGN